jgi:UDPglucose 6-dehydrogenase
MIITVVGTGFVGLVTAAVFASFGHKVYGLDVDVSKIKQLKVGKVPFYEPHLEELLSETKKKQNLFFTSEYKDAVPQSDLIIIAVGTPSSKSGGVDLTYVLSAIESMAPLLKQNTIIAIKSTVPPQAIDSVVDALRKNSKVAYTIATLPEFLREGSAVSDTLHPARIVIGAEDDWTFSQLEILHQPFKAPIVRTKLASAQMAKYAANAYLATRITFINQIADLCEKNHADVQEVISAIGFDPRIRSHYWYPGLGYGGSCFPKDVKELAYFSRQVGEAENLFNKIQELNDQRLTRLFTYFEQKVGGWKGKKVAILGLAFKPNTDDTREAPSTKLIPLLLESGAMVTAYDPKATLKGTTVVTASHQNHYAEKSSIATCCENADVIIIVTEWPEIGSFNYGEVRTNQTQYLIDTRNQIQPEIVKNWGYQYLGIGRGE